MNTTGMPFSPYALFGRGAPISETPGSIPFLQLPGAPPENPIAMGLGPAPPLPMPFSHLRRVSIANMDMSRATVAPVTVIGEVDATNLKALHDWIKPTFEAQTGVPLTYTPFFARATTLALKANPVMNALLTPHGYLIPRQINLGIATQIPGGVLLPTIRNAELFGVLQLALAIHALSTRARTGQITPPEMAEQTFIITNTGRYGGTLFGTPTVKPPNVGVLAFEAIRKRPAVGENDQVVVKPMMYLALTADHKAVDGVDMAKFMSAVTYSLENLSF